MVKRKMIKDK